MEQLIGAETQNVDDLGIESGDASLRERGDQDGRGGPPSLRRRSRYRWQARGRARRAVCRAPLDAGGRSACPDETADRISYAATRARGDHAGLKRSPVRQGCLRGNRAPPSAVLPSGCSSVSSTVPAPVATARPSPGGRDDRRGSVDALFVDHRDRRRITLAPSINAERVWPGLQATNQIVNALRRPAPIDDAVFLRQPLRVGGVAVVLRTSSTGPSARRRRSGRGGRAELARPCSTSALVSCAPIGRGTVASIGPASSARTTRMIVMPVSLRRRPRRDESGPRRDISAGATRGR